MFFHTWNKKGLFLTGLLLCFAIVFICSMDDIPIWYTQALTKPAIISSTFHVIIDETTRDNSSTELSSSLCKKIRFPGYAVKAYQWQVVGKNKTALVYSAFQETNSIKVIGMSSESGQFVCQLLYTKDVKSNVFATSVQASVKIMHQPRDTRYKCAIFTCTLPQENIDGELIGVSLSESPCHQPTNFLPVINKVYSNVSNNYTLCVSPLHDNYSLARELVGWIELNRILGADQFVFYNSSCSPLISHILNSYAEVGIVSVLDWKFPHEDQDQERDTLLYFGQAAALNDCLLRIKGSSQFVVNTDLDEVIIPRQKNVLTWNQMLKRLPTHDVYQFSNAFFKTQENDSWKKYSWHQNASKLHLVALLKRSRDLKIFDGTIRSKYMARVKSAHLLGVHKVLNTTGKVMIVPRSSGLLHHYKKNFKHLGTGKMTFDDIVVQKYEKLLIKRVLQRWKKLTGIHD